MSSVNRNPNWQVWANVPDVRVWEAVALSLGIDPKKVKTRQHAWMENGTHFPHDEGQVFEDRIEVLRRNIGEGNGLPLESIIMGRPDQCQISIARFAAWAIRVGWEIPLELQALAPKATRESPAKGPAVPAEKPAHLPMVEIALAAPDKVTLAWLWNHVPVGWWWALVAAFITVFGLGVSVGQSEFYSRITTPAKATAARAESGKVDLGLGSANADRFVNYLKTVPEPRERIRLGCAAADERACVLAGQLLDLFNRAGWTVLGDKVERVQLGKPTRAIVLFKRGEGDKPVAKGSGVWVAQTPSLQVLQGAFTAVGLVPEAAADATMPEGTIGVYVGPL